MLDWHNRICTRLATALLVSLLLTMTACQTATPHNSSVGNSLVITTTAPLHQLTLSLLQNTPVEVVNIPENPRSMRSQATYLNRQGEQYADLLGRADAVITMGGTWDADPLYAYARQYKLDVINIDATRPFTSDPAVSVVHSPVSGQVNPYFWLSPSNVIRSLYIIEADLSRLYQDHAEQIQENLQASISGFNLLRAEYEGRFLNIADPVIYALADEFNYLSNDMGLFVDGYFIKQDIDWTEQDLAQLTRHLQQRQIGVVIHKWQPSDEIIQAVEQAGARLIVLDTLELTSDPLLVGLKKNLEALLDGYRQ